MHQPVIPFFNFTQRYQDNVTAIHTTLQRVLKSGQLILGKEVERFEHSFAGFVGTKEAVGVNSGTDAIFLALKAAGVQPGDEVITVANTATPTVSAIRMAGATPVFADVKESDYTLDPAYFERRISSKTTAVVPVHLFGYPAAIDTITAIARRHQLTVIEDCAQAHGACYKGRAVGTWGDLGCFSFYPTKNLGAIGDGGMVVTASRRLAEQVRQLRNYGEKEKYKNYQEGVNSRLDELQAAYLSWALKKLPLWNRKRARLAQRYLHLLRQIPVILPPTVTKNSIPAWHLFVIRTPQRAQLQSYLRERGIVTAIHYPMPIYHQPAYHFLKTEPLLVTEKVMKDSISLPLYPELTSKDVTYVCNAIGQFFKQ